MVNNCLVAEEGVVARMVPNVLGNVNTRSYEERASMWTNEDTQARMRAYPGACLGLSANFLA